MPSSIAKNAQEGTRSEYLAQYILSTFGTAIPVPHPEDSGIDLYCTLGFRVGRRFHVSNHYLIQIKSSSATSKITYEGKEEIEWLLSHKNPLFIGIINKAKGSLEIFQTISISMLYAKNNINSITLIPESKKGFGYFSENHQEKNISIYLGDPILRVSVPSFEKKETKLKLSNTIKSWIELDQENIDLKSTGVTMFRVPKSWKTNTPVQALEFRGNFKDNLSNIREKDRFNDLLFKLLTQQVNQAVSNKDVVLFNSTIQFVVDYCRNNTVNDGLGISIMQFCIKNGSKELGIKSELKIYTATKNA